MTHLPFWRLDQTLEIALPATITVVKIKAPCTTPIPGIAARNTKRKANNRLIKHAMNCRSLDQWDIFCERDQAIAIAIMISTTAMRFFMPSDIGPLVQTIPEYSKANADRSLAT